MHLDNSTKPWIERYRSCDSLRERILGAFSGLHFDEGPHIYTLGGVVIPSVSSLVDHFIEPFDAEGMAKACHKKGYDDPSSKYYRMSVEDIVRSWEDNARDAASAGTVAHLFAEACMYYMVGEYERIPNEYKGRLEDGRFVATDGVETSVAGFFSDMPDEYVPILSETSVYGQLGGWYAGTFDLLVNAFLPQGEKLVMFDYKTNKDLHKNYRGKRMINGFGHLLDTPKNHYEVQQALYENALNGKGFSVAGKRLVWLKEDGYEVVRMTERIIPILRERL